MAAAMAASTVLPAYAEELPAAEVEIVEVEADAIVVDEPASTQEVQETSDVAIEPAGDDTFIEEAPDVIVEDVPEAAIEPDDEIIIDNVEEVPVEEEGIEIEIPADEMEGMEISLDEEIALAEAGTPQDAANLSSARKRSLGSGLYAGMAGAAYVDSYGGELLGNYADVYNGCYKNFVTGDSMEEVVIPLSEAILFSVDIADPSVGVTSSDITSSEDYQENVVPEIKAIGQAANDAIAYDCPEVYWIENFNIALTSATTVTVNEDRTQAICGISKVKMSAKERFEDAYDSRWSFMEYVDEAYAGLSAELAGKPSWEVVKGVHDYICEKAVYGQANGAAASHTAAGFFLYGDDRYVVCDGYAKTLQVLLNKFGIKSVLIAGDVIRSSGDREAHAWNYVLLDGAYYLVDTTWDDEGSSAANTYLLRGWNSTGSTGNAISSERVEYNAFSKTAYSSTFARPALSNEEYHAWDEGVVTKDSTCSSEGIRVHTCPICNGTKETPVEKKEHSWKAAETIDREATCTEDGVKSIHCAVCDEIKEGSEVKILAKEHDWDDGVVEKEATCTEEGTIKYTCGNCKETKTENIQTKAHTWEKEKREDTAATCTEPGSKSIHCSSCGFSDESTKEPVPVIDHTWDKGVVEKKATCAQEGSMKYTCKACGETKNEPIGKTSHTWETALKVDKEATCTENGSKSIHCSACGESNPGSVVAITATGHTWGEGSLAKEPSCEVHGLKEYTCSTCGGKKTELINPAGHRWSSSMTVDQAPTCTAAGKGSYRCRTCNKVQTTVTIPATGHTYGPWSLKTPASIKSRAIQKRTCGACGHEETRYYGTMAKPALKLPSSSLTLKVKQKASYKVGIVNGDKVKTWKTSNKKIVQVKGKPDGSFTLTAQGKSGSAYIYVTTGSKITKKIKVTVKQGTSSISNVPKSVSVKKGKSYTLKVKKKPSNSIDTLTYTSSNPSVATVSSKGKITAKAKGTAVITVKAGSKVKKCTVKVK